MSAIVARYSRTAIVLHWVIALLIVANVALGLLFESFGEDNVRPLIDAHKSIGITVLGLAIMRLLWRATHVPPALPDHYKPWEKLAAKAAHLFLYVLIFAMPISGWLHDSAWKAAPEIKMYWFGLFEWPRIGWIMNMDPAVKESLHGLFGEVHESLALVLYLLVFLHVAGALKHQFIDKHAELQRMWS
ncbi:MAG: cytochrome b [Sphingomonadaceae bacterium]|nr:cytochrome b [Sphingomonadaceae bacterium]